MTIAILCGGSGTRLWPLSRSLLPKQFAPILENGSLFIQTLLRNAAFTDAHFQVIANEANYFLAQEESKQANIKIQSYILETIGKNTAPALCFSALDAISKYGKDEIILALPSDHLIKDTKAYQDAISEAVQYAKNGYLVTFGIKPTSPHTGYGYIEREANADVKKFTEKPNQELAQKYLQMGNHFWNSGMFCFKASVFLDELQKHSKDVYDASLLAYQNSEHNEIYTRISSENSQNIPDISIDYALMEKSKKIKCVIGDFSWNDVGSFESLCDEWPKDSQGNASKSEIIAKNSQDNFILSDKLVATIGINDLIVIDTNDSLLLAKKGQSQAIKDIVAQLKTTRPELTQIHTTAYRPWGSYSVLLETPYYKIKQIIVKPKCRLSLQKHFHRNEHWVVVSGSANVRSGDKEIFLKANESTYIPMGQLHRLENLGKIDLVIIEVQVGEYLGEDDIIRVEDDFRRC